MKKLLFLMSLCCVLAACTTKEQDEKVQSFWNEQFMQVMMKMMGGNMAPAGQNPSMEPGAVPSMGPGAVPPGNIGEKDMQEFEAMMKEWEKSQAQNPAAPNMPGSPAAGQPNLPAGSSATDQTAVVPAAPRRPRRRAAKDNQFIEIMVEDSSETLKGRASLKDRKAIQQALDKVLEDNQNMIENMGAALNPNAQAELFAVITKTEKALRKQAARSPSYKEYLKAQKQLLAQQEQSLNQLIQRNSSAARRHK